MDKQKLIKRKKTKRVKSQVKRMKTSKSPSRLGQSSLDSNVRPNTTFNESLGRESIILPPEQDLVNWFGNMKPG